MSNEEGKALYNFINIDGLLGSSLSNLILLAIIRLLSPKFK